MVEIPATNTVITDSRTPDTRRARRVVVPAVGDAWADRGCIGAWLWHACGMGRTRISTTVDGDLLTRARALRAGSNDSTLIDDALAALLARHRSAEIDARYKVAYADRPLDEADEWGDLASFRAGAAAT